MSDLHVSEVPESDIDRALDLADTVFHQPARESEGQARDRLRWMPRRAERFGVYDDGRLAAFLAAMPQRLSVPGGALECAAVTLVGVLPTHRRRGLLTAMMEHMLADSAARGRPLAALYASEGTIYGRYGYGLATHMQSLRVDTAKPLQLRVTPDPRPLRMVPREQAPEQLAPLYERVRARRAGQLERDGEWWSRAVLPPTPEEEDGSLTVPHVVLLDGPPGGYAIYRTRAPKEGAPGVVHLQELEAESPEVEAALWRYLASIDLTGKIHAWARPLDDLLPVLAADPFQLSAERDWHGLWLRLLDVGAALRARTWADAGPLVLEVTDDRLPANQGRWLLETGTAACTPTGRAPDLTLDVRELGSVYLGGGSATRLAATGIVTENTPGAAARLDTALAVPYAPYTLDDF